MKKISDKIRRPYIGAEIALCMVFFDEVRRFYFSEPVRTSGI